MKYDNQLRYAVNAIESYKGEMPMHAWLKTFSKQHPQMGSGDRKRLADLVYCYYRLGHAFKDEPIAATILAGIFLCHNSANDLLGYFKPEWNAAIGLPVMQKWALTGKADSMNCIFPWNSLLSESVEPEKFCE